MNYTEYYPSATFTAEAGRCERMAQLVLSHASAAHPLRILDIGCGTGKLICRLAEALPMARFVGLDISSKSIEEANGWLSQSPFSERVEFLALNYLEKPLGKFDLIVSDNVLHLIEGDDPKLSSKLSDELNPGGKLI